MTLKTPQVNIFSLRISYNFIFQCNDLVCGGALGGKITSKMWFGWSCKSWQPFLMLQDLACVH